MPSLSINPSTTTPQSENHPSLTMARLQQSARDILRNLETVISNGTTAQNESTSAVSSTNTSSLRLSKSSTRDHPSTTVPVSLEQALRSMFTSCTFGAAVASNCDDDDEEEDDDENDDSRTTSLNHGGVEKVGTSSTDSSSSIDAPSPVRPKVKRSKSVTHQNPTKKVVSSSKDSVRRLSSMHIMESSSTNFQKRMEQKQQRQPAEPTPSSSSSKVAADHIYEHLFFAEEQARRAAATAVENTATKNDTSMAITPNSSAQRPIVSPLSPATNTDIPLIPYQTSSHNDRVGIVPLRRMTQPFPMSKPHYSSSSPSPIMMTAPNKITTIGVSRNLTFDDDISAISAHTLEAMMTTTAATATTREQLQQASNFPSNDDATSQPPSLSKHPTNTITTTSANINSTEDTSFRAHFPRVHNIISPIKATKASDNMAQTEETVFCRAATIPRANQGRDDTAMESSRLFQSRSSSSASLRSKQQQRMDATGDRHNHARSPPRFRHGTPSSSRSMSSNNSCNKQKKHQSLQRHGSFVNNNSSFSPCTSGSGNQSFDQWRTVEQEFWDSVVANEDDDDEHDQETGTIPTKSNKKSKSSSSLFPRQQRRLSRSRFSSIDGWSERSHSRSRDTTTANSSMFSSSLTGISHGGSCNSSHGGSGTMISHQHRSQSWLALHPDHHPHDTFPGIFASTAIPDNEDDGFFLDRRHRHRNDQRRPSSASHSFQFDSIDSGEI